MPEAFDPYLQWLGIRDPQRPPNHYRLLGVELFESDPEVISNAADRQMAHVRTFQTGRHSAESQKLLNELAAAKVCLLHPEKKAAYDSQLRAELAAAAAVSPGSIEAKGTASPPPKLFRSSPAASPLVWLVASGFLAAAVLLALVLTRGGGRGSPSDTVGEVAQSSVGAEPRSDEIVKPLNPMPHAASAGAKGDSSPAFFSSKTPDGDPSLESQGRAPTRGKSPKEEAAKKFRAPPPSIAPQTGQAQLAPPTPQKTPKKPHDDQIPPLTQSLAAMRQAMQQRDLAAARQHFSSAEKVGLLQNQDQVLRWSDVFKPWEEFWEAVHLGIRECRQGEVLRGSGGMVEVVAKTDETITIRGIQEKGVSSTYSLRTLPVWMAVTLAEKKLPEQTADLAKAAFFLVDPEGDPQQAAVLCEQSERQGTPPGPGLMAAVQEALAAAPPAKPPATAAGKPRLPVPDKQTQEDERTKLRETLRARLAQARTPADKGVLAGELLEEAKEVQNQPAACFARLALARDLSLEAGEPRRFREVTEEMARRYDLDLVAEQRRAVIEAADERFPAAVRSALAHLAIELALEAVQSDSFEDAERLAKAARQYANMPLGIKGRDPNAIRQANELLERMAWYAQQREMALEAEKKLAQDPADAKAAHTLGMHLALIKEQWERGLPLLVKSDDATIRDLAKAEQATQRSVTAAEMVKLADQWSAAAAALDAPYQRAARRRAVYWYEMALPFLKDKLRARVLSDMGMLRQGETPRRN